MSERVVITGLGTFNALGTNIPQFWEGLTTGRSAIGPIGSIGEGTKIKVGAIIPDHIYDPHKHFSDEELSLLDRFSQFALIAAQEAIHDAGLGPSELENAAAIIATGNGGTQTSEDTYAMFYKLGKKRAHPLTIPKGMASAAASSISMRFGIKGPAFCTSSACASSAHAVAMGKMMIETGVVDVALVGGSEAPFSYGLLKCWEALRVVSADTCRPFSADRSGMVLGEGAGILVLESESHANKRGAHTYAELAGSGLTSDAGHITYPDKARIAKAMELAINNAGLRPDDVDYINAHGTGTQVNDMVETQAIEHVFKDHAQNLAITSTKSMHGHALGASSALELVATTLAVKHDHIPPTANFTERDEQCALDYVPNHSRQQRVDVALCNSFAFGGLNAVLLVKKIDEHIEH